MGTFGNAAEFGDVIVLATLAVANESAVRLAGFDHFRGKLLVDTTNPLDFSGGMPPKLAVTGNDSAGERLHQLLPDAHVVKAFSTVSNALMFRPDLPGGPPDTCICGNDDDAKARYRYLRTSAGVSAT